MPVVFVLPRRAACLIQAALTLTTTWCTRARLPARDRGAPSCGCAGSSRAFSVESVVAPAPLALCVRRVRAARLRTLQWLFTLPSPAPPFSKKTSFWNHERLLVFVDASDDDAIKGPRANACYAGAFRRIFFLADVATIAGS